MTLLQVFIRPIFNILVFHKLIHIFHDYRVDSIGTWSQEYGMAVVSMINQRAFLCQRCLRARAFHECLYR